MYHAMLCQTPLFAGAKPGDLPGRLARLTARGRRFKKGAVLLAAGQTAPPMGLVLEGRVQMENDDVWGNKSILSQAGPGQIFAETYAFLPAEPMMVSVVAAQDCRVLFLEPRRLLAAPAEAECALLTRNLLYLCAQKNLSLSRRIFHTGAKTIRGRLLAYLSFEARHQGCDSFTIAFDRQQLADYLGVERSALSHELGKMQKEGLLKTRRSHFTLTPAGRRLAGE